MLQSNYATVKEQLLKEFKLTPREYRSKFMDAKQTAEETYTMFTLRLNILLNLERVGEVSLQGVAGEAIPAKLVKIDVR